MTDSRYQSYVEIYGDESWELDSLEPSKFRTLIESELDGLRDDKVWKKDSDQRAKVKQQLKDLSKDWEGVAQNKKALADAEASIAELTRQNELLKRKRKPKK